MGMSPVLYGIVSGDSSYIFCSPRSNTYIDGTLVVANDGTVQVATERCKEVNVTAGTHLLFVEGWSKSSTLSISVTYRDQGPSNPNSSRVPFSASTNPFSPSTNATFLSECDPGNAVTGNNNFTICFFKAADAVDLRKVDDVFALYDQVNLSLILLSFL
jgi:hypothetical protein